MKKETASLKFDEQTFYAICTKAWKECSANQKAFVAFNSTYTPEYMADAQKALQTAKDLPNLEARQAIQARMKTILEGKAAVCNGMVQNLFVIIARTFPEDQVESMRQEAGSGYYHSAAGGDNWNSADTMYGMVASFLVAYNEDLLNGNMPENFTESFTEARSEFDEAFADYSEARDNVGKGSVAKNTANATVHKTLMSMLADGKAIYRKDAAMKKYFSFHALKVMVAGPAKTGIRFSLTETITKLPVANAVIMMQPGNYTLYPDKKGVAEELVPADKYTYTITTPGMETVEAIFKVKAGGVRRVNVVLAKADATQTGAPEETKTSGDGQEDSVAL